MKRRMLVVSGLFCSILMTPLGAEPLDSQDSKAKAPAVKESRIDGNVHMIDKDTGTITVRLRGKTAQQEVLVDKNTKYTFRNKTASAADLKDGNRVIVLGTLDDKNRLRASRVDIRDER